MSRRPDTFIVGAPKCGTTSLYEYLRGHPDIYMSVAKEPRYFGNPLSTGHLHDLRYGDDEGRYLKLFAEATNERRVGEASPGYLYEVDAPIRIRDFQPDARIIVMVREPVQMIHSLHHQLVTAGIEDVTDFATAMAPGPDSRRSVYIDRGSFARHLPRWVDTFGRDRVHVIVFEDLVSDPGGTYDRVLEFLDVDRGYRPDFVAHNRSHAARFPRLRTVVRTRGPQWLVWRAIPAVIGDRRLRRTVRRLRTSPLGRKESPRAQLPADLREELRGEFASDVAELSEMLDRDFAALWWHRESESG